MSASTKLLAICAWVLAVAGAAGASVIIGGQQIPNGPLVIKYVNYDVGTLYGVPNGTYSGEANLNTLPQTSAPGGLPGEDSWGIFRVESIQSADQTVTYYNRYTATQEITGIVYGERDTFLSQTGSGSTLTQNIQGAGMHVAFFADSANNYNPTGGPTARAADGNYPTATDGQLIWTFNSMAGWDATFPTSEFFTTFRPNATAGDVSANGGMFAAAGTVPGFGTGVYNDQVSGNVRLDFTGAVGTNGWLVNSNDPVRFSLVPEPTTMVLLGLGGLALLRRRRA